MTIRHTLAVALFATTTTAGPAYAQAPTANEPPATADTASTAATAPAIADAAATDDVAAPHGRLSEPGPAPHRWPRAVFARTLTLPSGIGMLGADLVANHDVSALIAAPIVGYGITDDFEIQVPYAFLLKEFEAKGTVNIDVGYKLLRGAAGGKLEAIARIRGGYDLLGEAATPLMIGVHVQYSATDKLALSTGTPGSQQLRVGLAEDAAMAKPIDFSLPVAVGYQATPELYVQLDTKLAQFDIKDSANVFIGADATPVLFTAVYNVVPALDVQAAVGTDLSNEPADTLVFLVGARYYAGRL